MFNYIWTIIQDIKIVPWISDLKVILSGVLWDVDMDKEDDEAPRAFWKSSVACTKTFKSVIIISFEVINPRAILRNEQRHRKIDFRTSRSWPLNDVGLALQTALLPRRQKFTYSFGLFKNLASRLLLTKSLTNNISRLTQILSVLCIFMLYF